MAPTGAITVGFEEAPFATPPLSEEAAVLALLEGHRTRAYVLPQPLIAAAEGASAVAARATAVHLELNRAAAALDAGPARLVAEIVRAAATSGSLPAVDAGAEMIRLEDARRRLGHEDAVLAVATEKIATYPVTIARASAGAIADALDGALGKLLAAARPSSATIAALGADADNLRAHRADPKGFDALERLSPRLGALEAARDALARLGVPWTALPPDDGTPAVLRLARLAAEP
jgi:hypothetical protein